MVSYINHELLTPGALEYREYQVGLALEAADKNSLVVLPTGLGKTPILLLLALSKWSEGKVLVLAPTRPLVEQHRRFFRAMMVVPDDEVEFVHGLVPPSERARIYSRAKVLVATPQTIRSDLDETLAQQVALVCFDEAHRAVGAYAYCDVAAKLRQFRSPARVVGLTASPGTTPGAIDEVCLNLGIVQRLSRSRTDPDVAPYVQQIAEVVVEVPLEPQMAEALKFPRLKRRGPIEAGSLCGSRCRHANFHV